VRRLLFDDGRIENVHVLQTMNTDERIISRRRMP